MRNLDDALIRRKFFKAQVRARASLSITRQDFLPQTSIAGLATNDVLPVDEGCVRQSVHGPIFRGWRGGVTYDLSNGR